MRWAGRSRAPVVVLVLLTRGCGGGDPPPPHDPKLAINEVELTADEVHRAQIAIAPVEEREFDAAIVTTGRITFDDSLFSHVFSPIAGRITRIDANIGDHVEKGQTLAIITSPDFGGASSDLAKARADLTAAERNFKRQQSLFDAHAASELDRENAEEAYRKATAEFARARERIALLHGGSNDDAEVSQVYHLRAEISGDVTARGANPGMEVSGQYATGGNNELFTIGRLDRVWVLADLYEIDLPQVHVGDEMEITTVAYPGRVFHGTVDLVSITFDPGLRTAHVRCTLDNRDRALRPEMYAAVRVRTGQRRGLAIDRAAVFRLANQTFAFIVREDTPPGIVRFARIPVVADEGQATGPVEVTRGLVKGQRVAVAGVTQLRSMLDNATPRAATARDPVRQ